MYPLGTASSRIEYANSFPSASKRGRSAKRYAQSRCADVSCVRKSLSFWYSETAVSYTHLDVYKRQGVEASASHVNELKNPNRNYPLAMIGLAILTIALDALGGLAVATTLPASVLDGNLSFGVIEAFRAIFVQHIGPSMSWIVFVVALLLALGVLAEISEMCIRDRGKTPIVSHSILHDKKTPLTGG